MGVVRLVLCGPIVAVLRQQGLHALAKRLVRLGLFADSAPIALQLPVEIASESASRRFLLRNLLAMSHVLQNFRKPSSFRLELFERAMRITYVRLLGTGLIRTPVLSPLRSVVSDEIARAISTGERDEWRAARRGLFAGCALLMSEREVERPQVTRRSLTLIHDRARVSTALR